MPSFTFFRENVISSPRVRRVCHTFRPVAQELIYSSQSFGEGRSIERFICGLNLQSWVFGVGSLSINRLELKIEFVERENLQLLARLLALILSSLLLDFQDEDEDPFLRIRSLSLTGVDFGDDPDAISPAIRRGLVD
jgi:hypothetical protein